MILTYIPQCVESNSGLNYFCNSKFLEIANYQESNLNMAMRGLRWEKQEGPRWPSEPVSLGQEEYQEGRDETPDRFWKERT